MMRRARFRVGTSLVLLLGLLLFTCSLHQPGNTPLAVQGWRPRFSRRRNKDASIKFDTATCAIDPFVPLEPPPETLPPTTGSSKWWSGLFELPDSVQEFLSSLQAIVMHEPPVGITAIAVTLRLLWTGRIFRVYKSGDLKSADGVLRLAEKRRKKRTGRSTLALDTEDRSYDSFGGVQRIRRRLCLSALQGVEKKDPSPQVEAAINALSVSYKPGSPRYTFVEEMAGPLSTLDHLLIVNNKPRKKGDIELRDLWGAPKTDQDLMLQLAAKTAEIRGLDALLRLSRDHLLTTSSRLRRNLKYWTRRVTINENIGWVFDRIMRASVEGDRMRLAFARAALTAELARLGVVQQTLIDRPADMNDKALLESLSRSHNTTDPQEDPQKREKQWKIPTISKYSLRFNAEGRGRLSLRVYDGETTIRSDVAQDVLLHNDEVDPRQWIEEAHDWTERSRRSMCQVLKESIENSAIQDNVAKQELQSIDTWCAYDARSGSDLNKEWLTVLDLTDNLESGKRVGEGRAVQIGDAGLQIWLDRLDIFGVPSALATVGLAKVLHNILVPYWPQFKRGSKEALIISWQIFKARFWLPFYGIMQGLMNKSKGLLDAFDIENEEKSLDNMLFDLGFGDGTEATRKEALQLAARHYEDDLSNGVFKSAFRGDLVRLLLLQVQQLKSGLLHAMSSIDVLVDANRLNMQILAAIPAVLIVTIGTRLVLRSLFTFKAKAIRSVRDVHAEMSEYLDDMEIDMVLAAPTTTIETNADGSPTKKTTTFDSVLQPIELGKFIMRVHTYLVLLDYCSPLLPKRATVAIHKAMQELVESSRLGADRQAALLRLIKQKHMDLLEYL